MGHTNLRHSLDKKYASLTGELEHVQANIARIERELAKLPELEARIPDLNDLIESVSKLLKSIDPDWSPEQTEAIRPWTHTLPIPFGSCGRRGMEVLRCSDKPLSARQIAVQVLRECGQETPEKAVLDRTTIAIDASLRKHRGKTVESSGKYPMQWRSVIKQDIEFDP
jgi:hypothetical protein